MTRAKKSIPMGAAECARRAGLTVRALRVYERHRLIEPRRTAKGWRCYGPQELRRLNVIVTLKAFGMTLAQIGTLLATRPPPLARVLQLQLQVCSARREAADKAVGLVKAALATLESGKRLSLDNLCNLTRSMEMENQHALFQVVREQINETITPEEERAVMTWMAARPADEMKAIHEASPAVRVVLRSLQDLREKKVDPAAPEAQALIVRENELAVRYGLRNHTATLLEWNTPVALKWLQMGGRAVSRFMSSRSAAPDEGLTAYLHAAQVASPWRRALEPIVDEAAVLVDKKAQPSGALAQVLVGHLRRICADHSLGDPLVHARWARAILFRWPAEDNARKQAAWAFLASAIKSAKRGDDDDDGAPQVIPTGPPKTPSSGSRAFVTTVDDGDALTPGAQNKVPTA
jgi:DNA-binding transcriptional MerR regulator